MDTRTEIWDPPTEAKLSEICEVLGITSGGVDGDEGIISYPYQGRTGVERIMPGAELTTVWNDGETDWARLEINDRYWYGYLER